ncbi:MAG: Bax inhibitor-1/YccA family protein [Magnetococcales bacterium]|nr:Bax inhibitor-1/YccA family protein [Magnetococcales bacterium]
MNQNPFGSRPRLRAGVMPGPFAGPASTSTSATAYLKQVYALVAASLLLSVVAGLIGMNSPFARENQLLLIFVQLGALLLAFWKKNTPTLFLFTGLSGFCLGPIIGFYVSQGMSAVVGQAVLMTGLIFTGLSFYALTTKRDLSMIGGMLFAGLIVLVVGGLLNLFFQSTAVAFALSAAGAVIFSGYILWETQQLKDHPGLVPPAIAALSMYLNILNLFLSLLRMLGILGSDE